MKTKQRTHKFGEPLPLLTCLNKWKCDFIFEIFTWFIKFKYDFFYNYTIQFSFLFILSELDRKVNNREAYGDFLFILLNKGYGDVNTSVELSN